MLVCPVKGQCFKHGSQVVYLGVTLDWIQSHSPFQNCSQVIDMTTYSSQALLGEQMQTLSTSALTLCYSVTWCGPDTVTKNYTVPCSLFRLSAFHTNPVASSVAYLHEKSTMDKWLSNTDSHQNWPVYTDDLNHHFVQKQVKLNESTPSNCLVYMWTNLWPETVILSISQVKHPSVYTFWKC